MKISRTMVLSTAVLSAAAAASCANQKDSADGPVGVAQARDLGVVNTGSYNLQLQDTLRFLPTAATANADNGRALFGFAPDLITGDSSQALFQGPSQAFGGTVVSNGRTCFTCHRGGTARLGFPALPLSSTIPLTDPLFTGIDADAQGDPDAMYNLDQLGLIKHRPNRFNEFRPETDPYRQVFGWRKSIKLINVAFAHALPSDGRARLMFEVDRGAVFAHTQSSDNRFDDLFPVADSDDMQAFQFSFLSDPALAPLLSPSDPGFLALALDPFATVHVTTLAQWRGEAVFAQQCMTCHNTPNVFNNISNVSPTGSGERPETNPCFAPAVGRLFDVGVAEQNANDLRFTQDLGNGSYAPIVLPMANEDGTTTMYTVTFDIGLAATTARTADIGRFKVPQLRGVALNGPYFHDNSAATLEEVVDFFNSPAYNNSRDGRNFPVFLSPGDRADLLAFLNIL